jgi:hypothetical protein
MRSQRGQIMPYLIILIPILILLSGIAIRHGMILLIHNKIQFHCDQRVLDALAIEARGMRALGKLNPYGRRVIDTRRKIDLLLLGVSGGSEAALPLVIARNKLRLIQAELQSKQSHIIRSTENKVSAALSNPLPPYARLKAFPQFTPEKPSLPVERETAYKGETGGPLRFSLEAQQNKTITGFIKIHTERFLEKWPGMKPVGDIQVNCAAQMEMKNLEMPWTVALVYKGARH